MRKAIIILGFLVLSACGGGGGTAVNPGFLAQQDQLDVLCNRYNCNEINLDDYSNYNDVVDVLSEVTYSGVAAYIAVRRSDSPPTPEVIFDRPFTTSEIVLMADFDMADLTVGGTLTNFQPSSPNETITGSLDITGDISFGATPLGKAVIDDAVVTGTLTVSSPATTQDITYAGTVDAIFLGADAKGVIGNDGVLDGGGDSLVYFTFIAERP